MADFQPLFKEIQNQVLLNAESLASEYKEQAVADGKQLLNDMKTDLERWLILLGKGELKASEFEWLVNSNKSLLKMTALKQSGLAAVQVKKFSTGLLATIVDTSLKTVLAGKS